MFSPGTIPPCLASCQFLSSPGKCHGRYSILLLPSLLEPGPSTAFATHPPCKCLFLLTCWKARRRLGIQITISGNSRRNLTPFLGHDVTTILPVPGYRQCHLPGQPHLGGSPLNSYWKGFEDDLQYFKNSYRWSTWSLLPSKVIATRHFFNHLTTTFRQESWGWDIQPLGQEACTLSRGLNSDGIPKIPKIPKSLLFTVNAILSPITTVWLFRLANGNQLNVLKHVCVVMRLLEEAEPRRFMEIYK